MAFVNDLVRAILDWILGLQAPLIYGVVAVLAFGATAFGLDLILPSEVGMALAGLVASRGEPSLLWMFVVAAAGATLGDSISYWLGRRFGRSVILDHDWLRARLESKIERTQGYFDRHGPKTVFLGRYLGALRAVVPLVAGMGRMEFPRFLLWNVLASITWAPLILTLGYFFGGPFVDALRNYTSYFVWGVLGIGAIVVLVRWVRAEPTRLRWVRDRFGSLPGVEADRDREPSR